MEKNTILINKKILESKKNFELSGDIVVPDSKPDLVNVIVTNVNPYIFKEEISGGRYRYDGKINANIVYLSANGENLVIQSSQNFTEFIEDPNLDENTTTKYKIRVVSVENKVLNERKISLNVKLEIKFEFYKKDEEHFFCNFDNMENVEKLVEDLEIKTLVAQNKISTSLQENFDLGSNAEISDVLKFDISISNIENKVSYNKVLSKADANIKLMYLSNEMNVETYNTTIPLMNFIDMENIEEDNSCEINYKIRGIDYSINEQEKNKVNCKIDFEVCAMSSKNQKIQVIQDMYGIDKKIIFDTRKIEFQNSLNYNSEKVSINESILLEDARQILDVNYVFVIENRNVSENSANCEGEMNVSIYYTSGKVLSVKNARIPFMFRNNGNLDDIEINLLRNSYKLDGEYLILNLEIDVKSSNQNCQVINIIDNVQMEEENVIDDYSMVIYMVKPGDTIWKIAKSFSTPIENINKLNNLEEKDMIYPGEKLYIMK